MQTKGSKFVKFQEIKMQEHVRIFLFRIFTVPIGSGN